MREHSLSDFNEFYHQLDRHLFEGLVTTQRGAGTNNGLSYTSWALCVADLLGCEPQKYARHIIDNVKACQVEPGLYGRHIGKTGDHQGIDDYLALATCFLQLGLQAEAQAMLAYARKSHWLFNNKRDGFRPKSYFGPLRYPAFAFILKLASGETPSTFETLGTATAFLIAAGKPVTNQDGWIRSWLMAAAIPASKTPPALGLAIEYFWWKYERLGVSVGTIFGAYCGDNSHFLARLWPRYASDVELL